MATIDPAVRRSATVRANEPTVVARIEEAHFSRIANDYPILWRCIARELAERLRQRANSVLARRNELRIFIASSSEALQLARSLKTQLERHNREVNVWSDGIFAPGSTNIEALERELSLADFAAIVLSPDDRVFSRLRFSRAPRDNLVLELGLFMGAIGRQRGVMIYPRKRKLKLPSDLLGVTPIRFTADDMSDAAGELNKIIERLGPR